MRLSEGKKEQLRAIRTTRAAPRERSTATSSARTRRTFTVKATSWRNQRLIKEVEAKDGPEAEKIAIRAYGHEGIGILSVTASEKRLDEDA